MVRKGLTLPSPSPACGRLAPRFVIPGRHAAASPESITTIGIMDSGPAPRGASRNDARETGVFLLLHRICMPNIAPCRLTPRLRARKLPPCTPLPIHPEIRKPYPGLTGGRVEERRISRWIGKGVQGGN